MSLQEADLNLVRRASECHYESNLGVTTSFRVIHPPPVGLTSGQSASGSQIVALARPMRVASSTTQLPSVNPPPLVKPPSPPTATLSAPSSAAIRNVDANVFANTVPSLGGKSLPAKSQPLSGRRPLSSPRATSVGNSNQDLPFQTPNPSNRGGARSASHSRASSSATPRRRPYSATLNVRLQDNPRIVIETAIPSLAGASDTEILRQLEIDRCQAEAAGNFILAQERADMLRAFAEYVGKSAERGISTAAEHDPAVMQMSAKYRTVTFEFTKMWEERFCEYDEKAEEALRELQSEQERRFDETENLVRSELAVRKPHYSRKVISKREELERLIAMRQYKEAERVRRDLVPMETEEEARFEENLNATLASKTKTLKKSQEAKMEALRMRIAQGREELMLQRRTDFFNLMLKHANGIEEAQLAVRKQAATERKYLHNQLSAMMVRSATKPVKFEKVLGGVLDY